MSGIGIQTWKEDKEEKKKASGMLTTVEEIGSDQEQTYRDHKSNFGKNSTRQYLGTSNDDILITERSSQALNDSLHVPKLRATVPSKQINSEPQMVLTSETLMAR